MSGRTLARYQLLEEVGHGGMAIVYKGLDTTLNREVAVKVLHPHLAGLAESRARLQREAHAVAKLRHENILEIFDYSGPDSPESYIVTEFIHGQTLKLFLNDHPLPYAEVAELIVSEVARALEHAHSLGVIHRDIKPENVMIRNDGILKLMDFGIAQIVDKERMTVTGQLLGSPAYMAPEHVEGRPLDFRTDVFALGILTYQLATGQLPFRGKNPHEVLKRIAECKYLPPEVLNPQIGERLARVIKKSLARDPQDRFPSVARLREELLADLADAGVGDARQELQRFFADPTGWANAFRPRLVSALTDRGRELVANRRTAAALELWSRALALEPKSPELLALVSGIARQRRIGQGTRYAAAAMALSLAVVGIVRIWPTPSPSAPDPMPIDRKSGLATATAAAHAATHLLGSASPDSSEATVPKADEHAHPIAAVLHRMTRSSPRPVAVEQPLRHFQLYPIPKNTRIQVDGKEIGEYGPSLKEVTIPKGPHTLTFTSNFCYPSEVGIAADQPGGDVRVRLKWKPAQLIVKSDPADSNIVIDDTITTHAGVPLSLPIEAKSENGRRIVSLKVSSANHLSKQIEVTLTANQTTTTEVVLADRVPE